MGYRLPEKRCDCHAKQIGDIARQSVISVDNGSISRFAIPSFYREHHDRNMHDHLGWPYPGHPDDSCQLPPGCDFILNEIDLPNEGYTSIKVSMTDPPDGLTFTGTIDYNVISLTITSMCNAAVNSDIDVKFCVYAVGTIENGVYGEEDIHLRDVVTKGTLHIIAGPIG